MFFSVDDGSSDVSQGSTSSFSESGNSVSVKKIIQFGIKISDRNEINLTVLEILDIIQLYLESVIMFRFKIMFCISLLKSNRKFYTKKCHLTKDKYKNFLKVIFIQNKMHLNSNIIK